MFLRLESVLLWGTELNLLTLSKIKLRYHLITKYEYMVVNKKHLNPAEKDRINVW